MSREITFSADFIDKREFSRLSIHDKSLVDKVKRMQKGITTTEQYKAFYRFSMLAVRKLYREKSKALFILLDELPDYPRNDAILAIFKAEEKEKATTRGNKKGAVMSKVMSFKMPAKTKHFNKGQRVWIKELSGSQSAFVTGKFRGFGRYVSVWVNWDGKNKDNPAIDRFFVDSEFAKRKGLRTY